MTTLDMAVVGSQGCSAIHVISVIADKALNIAANRLASGQHFGNRTKPDLRLGSEVRTGPS